MNFGFAFPMNQLVLWLAIGAAALAALAWALHALERRRETRLGHFVELALASRLLPGYDAVFRKPLFWLTLGGFAALLITFAQPHWGEVPTELYQQSRDVLVCLDVSESMTADDLAPSRIERAKQKILALLAKNPGDRFGLVVFSGAAELICPLTLDHPYFKAVLDAVDTDTMSIEGTDISAALRAAIESLQEQDDIAGVNDAAFRAIVLISDGEQVQGDSPAYAHSIKEYARFFVIGVGHPNGALVHYSTVRPGGRQREATEPHLSVLDEKTLARIATAGGGAYVRATPDNSDVEELNAMIETLAARETAGGVKLSLSNRYQWPLGIAIASFLLEGAWLVLLPHLRERRAARTEPRPEIYYA
jgi:Ca-activated chloride channel family protein